MTIRSLLRSSVVLLLMSTPLLAQTTQPANRAVPHMDESPDALAVRKAAKDFMLSLAKDDLADAKKLYAGTDEDFKGVEITHTLFVATRHLREAGEVRWPELAKQPQSDEMSAGALADRVDRMNPQIDGDSAVFAAGASLKKVGNEWKVVDVIGDAQAKLMMMTMFGTMTRAVDETTEQVKAGQYASWPEALEGMRTKEQQIVNAQIRAMNPVRPRATNPSYRK